jgi:hypothetical protein
MFQSRLVDHEHHDRGGTDEVDALGVDPPWISGGSKCAARALDADCADIFCSQ